MVTELRIAAQNELERIAKIYASEFSKPPYDESWTLEKAMKKIQFYNKNCDLYVIRYDDQVAGFIAINPNFMCPGEVAFGEELAIAERFQGKYITPIVLDKIFEIYKERGFKKFMGIVEKDSRPMKLYEKVGLVPSEKGVLIEKKL
ncbi:MAG: GNAT family N-acetyltransferase [Nanoarchaeota archaeon]